MATFAASPKTCTLKVNIFDGSRQLLPPATKVLITLFDGNKKQVFRDFRQGPVSFQLPFHDNFGDDYTVIAFADGYQQAGFFPVKVSPQFAANADVMLIPRDAAFSFNAARWQTLQASNPRLVSLLAHGAPDGDAARARYEDLLENRGPALACLLNIMTVSSQIQLSQGTPFDYLKEFQWDQMQQDRCFVWADSAVLDQIRRAAAQGFFQRIQEAVVLHPGATDSYKQVQFGEANLQITFHENDTRNIGGTGCSLLELDIDYFKDLLAHALLEVVVNGITGSLTDPKQVYVLRWIAGRHAGVPEFNPPYAIVAA